MKRCLISMEDCTIGEYSPKSLRQLHPKLHSLQELSYSQPEQMLITREQVNKISIQGVQPKYSVKLNLSAQSFEVIEKRGTFIMKPQNPDWAEFPENEAFRSMAEKHSF